MTKPPTDRLVWYTINYLGKKTDRLSVKQLKDYLVPNLLTLEELKEILKRGEDCGIIRKNYYMDDDKNIKFWIELGSYTTIPPQNIDMLGSVILTTLAYKEKEDEQEKEI